MGYRGEDVSATHGAWGRQTPWQSSPDDYRPPTAALWLRTRRRLPGTGLAGPRRLRGSRRASTAGLTAAAGGLRAAVTGSPYGQQQAAQRVPANGTRAATAAAGGVRPAGYDQPATGSRATTGTTERGPCSAEYGQRLGPGGYQQGSYEQRPADGYGADSGRYPGPAPELPRPGRSGLPGPRRRRVPGTGRRYGGQATATRPARRLPGQTDGYQARARHGAAYQGTDYRRRTRSTATARRLRPVRRHTAATSQQWQRRLPGAAERRPGRLSGRRTRGTTGTAGSPPRPTARASLTPARTGSTAGLSTSTAPARAARCATRCAATRPARSQTAGHLPTSVIPAVSGRAGRPAQRAAGAVRRQRAVPRTAATPGPRDATPTTATTTTAREPSLAGPRRVPRPRRPGAAPAAARPRPGTATDTTSSRTGDPYQDRYGDDATGPRAAARAGGRDGGQARGERTAGRQAPAARRARRGRGRHCRRRRLRLRAQAEVARPATRTPRARCRPAARRPSQQACVQQLGTYCHIEARTDDPTPLTTAELFPPAFTNETDKISYSLVSTKLDKTCSNAVIGPDLIKAAEDRQVHPGAARQLRVRRRQDHGHDRRGQPVDDERGALRGQGRRPERLHRPADGGQGSREQARQRHRRRRGRVQGPLPDPDLVRVRRTAPRRRRRRRTSQLEQFSNDLVAGTANIDLSQRMVTGAAPTPAASSPAASRSRHVRVRQGVSHQGPDRSAGR